MNKKQIETLMQQYLNKGGVVKKCKPGTAEGARTQSYREMGDQGRSKTQIMYYGGDR